jgi:hypothetical protein
MGRTRSEAPGPGADLRAGVGRVDFGCWLASLTGEVQLEGVNVDTLHWVMIGTALVICLPVWWAPIIIGVVRKHPQLTGILLVNLFLGWTIVGWVVALVWSTTTPKVASQPLHTPPA